MRKRGTNKERESSGRLTSPSLLFLLLGVLQLLCDLALVASGVWSVCVLTGLLLGSAFPRRAL